MSNHRQISTPELTALQSSLTYRPGNCVGTLQPRQKSSRISSYLLPVVLLLLFGVFAAARLGAQIQQGSLAGTIKDPSGAAVPGVHLTLTNTATGVSQTAMSTSAGTYVFAAVDAGTYTLEADAKGFEKYVAQNIQMHVQQASDIDIGLTVGGETQQVTITAAAPLLQTQDASVGETIQGKEINDLPLVNRNWASLAQLNAGVTTANANFSGAPGSAYFNIDGNSPWLRGEHHSSARCNPGIQTTGWRLQRRIWTLHQRRHQRGR